VEKERGKMVEEEGTRGKGGGSQMAGKAEGENERGEEEKGEEYQKRRR